MKEKINAYIEDQKNELVDMASFIFENPEIAFEEVVCSDYIANYLEKAGFEVEKGVGGVETAFRAEYEHLSGGPSIGLLTEYDALEGLGHACGHHLQAPAIVGAAKALKEVYRDKPYKLVIYGTPAEEGGGGKIIMLKNGCFKDIDVALMMHGGPETTTDVKSLASSYFEVTFNGVSAHAALKPEQGRSALDALLLTFQGIEFLREHVPDDVKMHYTILNAGGPANIVPKTAVAAVSLRSYSRPILDDVVNRVNRIFEGASMMTETTHESNLIRAYNNKIPVMSLNDLLIENAKQINAPNITPPREKTGSTDFGNVMFEMPGSCIRVAFVPQGSTSHSQEYLDSALSQKAFDAIEYGAKILAGASVDLIENPELLLEIKSEFVRNKAQNSIQ